MIEAHFEETLESWRAEARGFLARNISPELIHWSVEDEPTLFQDFQEPLLISHEIGSTESQLVVNELGSTERMDNHGKGGSPAVVFQVPAEFLTLARFVSCHRDPKRWALLYRLLYRLKHETKSLLSIQTDADVHKARLMMKSVTKDIHKMHAFVRFKKVIRAEREFYIAWHRPEHLIVEEATPFFQRRFGDRPWCILTPDKSALWDLKTLRFGEGVPQHSFQVEDDFDQLWKSYYSSIFNPARINIKAMKKEMAPKYWSSLPEAEIVTQLIKAAPQRLQKMAENQNRQALVPKRNSVQELMPDLQSCRACPLYAPATQVVCGEGSEQAEIMIVGEQPGDQEDLAGRPFVGPAGAVLDEALTKVGLDRETLYLTNAVKHFKFEPQGKARLHKRASGTEMHACKPWLQEEIKFVQPKIILALGVTAATSLLGRQPKIGEERGQILSFAGKPYQVILSWHPASILRAFSPEEARQKAEQLASDLRKAKDHLISSRCQ